MRYCLFGVSPVSSFDCVIDVTPLRFLIYMCPCLGMSVTTQKVLDDSTLQVLDGKIDKSVKYRVV